MSQAIKVGLFATAALVALAFLVLRIEDIRLLAGDARTVTAEFDSVAGLDRKASVRIAGVRVGRVDEITLSGQKARVHMVLETETAIPEGTVARISNLGLLGEKYVSLDLGPSSAPALAEDAVIPGITPPSIDDAIAQIGDIGTAIEQSLGALSGGEGGGDLGQLIANLEAVSAEVRALIAANRGQIEATIGNVEDFSAVLARDLPRLTGQAQQVLERMEGTLAQVQGAVGDNRGNIDATVDNLRQLTERAQASVDNLNTITGRLAQGEGTLGKLMTDDTVHDSLVSTLEKVETGVDDLSGVLGAINRVQLDLDLQSWWLEAQDETRSALMVDIDPQQRFRYRLGVVDTPFGQESSTLERITVTDPDGTERTTVIETFRREDDYSFNAMLGFDLFDETKVWAGLIESEGGVQVEHPFLDERLWLSLEAYDFDRRDDLSPHLRLSTRWQFTPNFYLVGGYDDFLESERESIFIGGGITWRDDTLKYLLGSVPTP